MNKFLGMTVLALLAAGTAMPVVAQQMDAGTLTCEAYLAMSAGQKDEATNAVTAYVADAANATTTAAAAELIKGMDTTATQQALDAACVGAPVGATVPMALEVKK